MVSNVVRLLPGAADVVRRAMAADDVAHDIIHPHLVIEVVEAVGDVVAVLAGVVDLADKHDMLVLLLHLAGGPSPEGGRHHLGHVAAEGVDALGSPEHQDVEHLLPCRGNRVKVAYTAGIVVYAVVQLHGLVPVVLAWSVVEAVVARGLGRLLSIRFHLALIEVEVRSEALPGTVVEVVLRVEAILRVVTFAEVLDARRLTDTVILTCHMVGHEVDDDLQSRLMTTLHQLLKLLHTLCDVDGQVGVDVVVVGDGIGRAGLSLHDGRMVARNAVGRIVCLRSVAYDAGIPNMTHAHGTESFQYRGREVVQFSTTVLFYAAVLLSVYAAITIETGKYLIDDYFLFHASIP